MEDIDDMILRCVSDKFMTITEITEQLTSQGVEVNRNTVVVHVRKLSKYGEVFAIIGDNNSRGVKPPKYRKIDGIA